MFVVGEECVVMRSCGFAGVFCEGEEEVDLRLGLIIGGVADGSSHCNKYYF